MPATQPAPAGKTGLLTLELGVCAYGVKVVPCPHSLQFEPLPGPPDQTRAACGMIRLADGTTVPVFDLRSPGQPSRPHRMLVTMGAHTGARPVAIAFLLDAPPALRRTRANGGPRARARSVSAATDSRVNPPRSRSARGDPHYWVRHAATTLLRCGQPLPPPQT